MIVYFQKFNKLLAKKLVPLLVVITLLIPINYYTTPKTEAGPVGGPVTVVGDTSATGIKTAVESTLTTVNTGLSSVANTSLALKENFLDGIFNSAAKIFLRSMVTSIVNWINSGFQGSPAFVTDLDGFLRSVADQTIGEFIYNDPALNFLCSPFQLDVKIAIATQYGNTRPGNYQPQCTLSGVVNNVDGFLAGDFSQGGWGGLIEMVQKPSNNPTGAFISAQSEAYIRILDSKGQEIKKLDFGDGFFSMEICDSADKASGAKPNCTIGTPGSVISNSINKALGAGQDELIAADEINEIFNALFAQLAQKAISGVYGLLGLGGNSSYSDNSYGAGNNISYLDAINEADASSTVDTTYLGASSPIAQSIKFAEDYQTAQFQIVGRVNGAENTYNTRVAEIEASGCNVDFTFPSKLTNARKNANTEIAQNSTTITLLKTLNQNLKNASDINEQQKILNQYQQLNSQGSLKTPTDVVQAELYIEYDLAIAIDNMKNKLDNQRCLGNSGEGNN